MRDDRPSNTAAFVAMGRALAHAHQEVRGFSDPFALELLPDDCRAAVDRRLGKPGPRSRRVALLAAVASAAERLMGPRTAEIDEGLREMTPGFQLVILGAGLDARAYRMPELAGSVVFELDHPATQAFKRTRAGSLRPLSRELRYVPVDFTRQRASDALSAAGHDATRPTAWIFEGVITYLRPTEVEASLNEIAARSARGSRLFATYNERSRLRSAFSAVTRWAGEPARASYKPPDMHALLEARGYSVTSDRDGAARAERWGGPRSGSDRLWLNLHHVVIADY